MPSAHLRIDTSLAALLGPSSARTSAKPESRTPVSSALHSVKPSQRLRSASSASTSSQTSDSAYAIDRASTSYLPSQAVGTNATHLRLPSRDDALPADTRRDSSEYVLAMHDFIPQNENVTCLRFQAGQIIRVLNRDTSGWWDGELDGRRGWFPSNYVTSDVSLLSDEALPQLMVSAAPFCASVSSWARRYPPRPSPTRCEI